MKKNKTPKDFKIHDYMRVFDGMWRETTSDYKASLRARREAYIGSAWFTMEYKSTNWWYDGPMKDGNFVVTYTGGLQVDECPDEIVSCFRLGDNTAQIMDRVNNAVQSKFVVRRRDREEMKSFTFLDGGKCYMTLRIQFDVYRPYPEVTYPRHREPTLEYMRRSLSREDFEGFKRLYAGVPRYYDDRPIPTPNGVRRRHNRALLKDLTDQYNTFGEVDGSCDFWDGNHRTSWDW